jgi:tRNA A-37 threonylcarbamoyl transferase component Bud32
MAKTVNVALTGDTKDKAESKAVDVAALLAAVDSALAEADAATNVNQLKKVVKDILKRERAMLRLLKKLAS